MQTKKLLLTLFEYKAWANKDLYELLSSVSPESHPRQVHDALRILNHIYVVDQIFRENLQSRQHSFTALNTPATPLLADLHGAVLELDAWFITHLIGLPEDSFSEQIAFTFVDGTPGSMTRGEMLLHVATHGNYHRGAVGRILFQISVQPPKDTLTVYLSQLPAVPQ
ncbi:DinB family protein [Undibacterium sp. TJN19]|uniref:DinB family protein n=1 Tax=Undibacterium sp. TJN19 TaxID=3413055 RepID=UPI003BF1A8B2